MHAKFFAAALTFLGLSAAFPAPRWGDSAHKLIAAKAVQFLPDSTLKLFAVENEAYLVGHTMDPDARKGVDPFEEANHYIDLERYGIQDPKSPLLASGFPEPKVLVDGAAHEKPRGRLPWRIEEVYERLVVEMRTGGWEQARQTMAELVHYVADAAVPFHTTENYDGQLTGQKGAHARFETELVGAHLAELEAGVSPEFLVKALDAAARKSALWGALRTSFEELPSLLQADQSALKEKGEGERAAQFWKAKGSLIEKRFARAIWLAASFWQSAWVDAGSPTPLLLAPRQVHPPTKVFTAEEAKDHVGEEATIEFVVAKVGFSKKSNTTYINSHDPHEGHFTAVVFSDALSNVEKALGLSLRDGLAGKKVRIRGKIQLYKGSPEIIVEKSGQIEMVR